MITILRKAVRDEPENDPPADHMSPSLSNPILSKKGARSWKKRLKLKIR
jgi:hypothetical protein